jgi:hypothetical protein
MKIRLENVQYMPKVLEPGVLYVSKEFSTAAHLCACGCGNKIRTPLGPTEWSVQATSAGPTMHPSIGNWQQPCKSHYVIWNGEIQWAGQWTAAQIAAGRADEQRRLKTYLKSQNANIGTPATRLWKWLRRFF